MGGEPPIRRVLGPDHREEDRATRNLAREKGKERSVEGDRREGNEKRENWKNSGKIYRVSDSREEGE
jgi:hypothetical protein